MINFVMFMKNRDYGRNW